MRPVPHAGDKAMPHRIEVNIVNMPLEIPVIADRVLPKSALP